MADKHTGAGKPAAQHGKKTSTAKSKDELIDAALDQATGGADVVLLHETVHAGASGGRTTFGDLQISKVVDKS